MNSIVTRRARRHHTLGAAVVATLALAAASANAEEATDTPLTLEQRLEQQEQRIKVLERRLELQQDEARATAAAAPVPKAGSSGFSLQSAKGDAQIKFRGVIHADHRAFLNDSAPTGADSFLLRRVRPTLEGTVGGIFDFRFTPDFGGGKTVIQDAYVTARFHPAFNVTAGKFKTPYGLERLQGSSDIRFVERGLPANLGTNRDIGLQFGGELLGGALSYAVAYANGVNDGGSSDGNASPDVDNNDDKDLALRLFAQPFRSSDRFALRGLGFGVAATHADSTGSPTRTLLSSYRSPGQQNVFGYRSGATATFADGERLRLAYQGHYYLGAFGLLGEYHTVSQDVTRVVSGTVTRSGRLDQSAWQLAGGYFLTGEDAGFRVPSPASPWKKGGDGWGALELVARVGELDVDDAAFSGGAESFADPATAISRAFAWSVGLNWYLTQGTKFAVDYEQTRFDGGAAGGADRPDEKVVFSRVQIAF